MATAQRYIDVVAVSVTVVLQAFFRNIRRTERVLDDLYNCLYYLIAPFNRFMEVI